MPNEVTPRPVLVYPKGMYRWGNRLYPVIVSVDTPAENITVKAAAPGKSMAIISAIAIMPTNEAITLKSGTTQEAYAPLGTNSGKWDKIDDGICYQTQPGEALNIEMGVASGSPNGTFLFYVAEIEMAA